MLKIIKHGNTVHTYKCIKCGCIFTANKRDIEIEDINSLLHCPECGYYISENDIIDDRETIKDKLFEKVNVPSCWNIEDHNKNMKGQDTSATVDNSKRLNYYGKKHNYYN